MISARSYRLSRFAGFAFTPSENRSLDRINLSWQGKPVGKTSRTSQVGFILSVSILDPKGEPHWKITVQWTEPKAFREDLGPDDIYSLTDYMLEIRRLKDQATKTYDKLKDLEDLVLKAKPCV